MSIAEKLQNLFAQTAGPEGRPVTMQEIVFRMREGGISTMSVSYLQQLRKGHATNPSLQHMKALAQAFDVDISYFDDGKVPSPDPGSELTPRERTVALRVHGLSDEALSSIHAIIELARKGEKLDDPAPARAD